MDDRIGHSSRPMSATSSRRSSQSYASPSLRSARSVIANLGTNDWKRIIADELKILALIIPSLIVVIALCSMTLRIVHASIKLQTVLRSNLEDADAFGQLANVLQKERGRTCVYITTLNNNSGETEVDAARSTMDLKRNETDAVLQLIDHWPANESDGLQFSNKSIFVQSLNKYRSSIARGDQDCEMCLQFYTAIDNKLIEMLNRPFRQTDEGQFWALVESYHVILLAKDYIGLQRAIGSVYFAKGYFTESQQLASFAKITGATDRLLIFADHLMPPSVYAYYWRKIYANQNLITELDRMRSIILNGTLGGIPDVWISRIWFDNMSTYLDIIQDVDAHISQLILDNLKSKSWVRTVEYYLTIACVVCTMIVCPPATCWYLIRSRTLVRRVQNFVHRLSTQNRELTLEKQKTDLLLYQLLPKSIALELKQNKSVKPEHYEQTTIYFSDIQGFTGLASRSTPMEIITLLNEMYTVCDNILDQYDVYKVETIGDAYMVVSGAPKRNETAHSAEIATMALHILMIMEQFEIPHLPNERVLVRIGIHTGPIAAGVVGTKMPRYCMFGDTVTTALTMESSGMPLRIQLSRWTKEHLDTWHSGEFETIQRGGTDTKFRKAVTTYWLLEKRGFPFRADMRTLIPYS